MPGKWQVAIVQALARESPLPVWQLRHRLQADTAAERSALKRACRTLLAQGLLERRAEGVYALVVDAEALLRARFPSRGG